MLTAITAASVVSHLLCTIALASDLWRHYSSFPQPKEQHTNQKQRWHRNTVPLSTLLQKCCPSIFRAHSVQAHAIPQSSFQKQRRRLRNRYLRCCLAILHFNISRILSRTRIPTYRRIFQHSYHHSLWVVLTNPELTLPIRRPGTPVPRRMNLNRL